MKAIKVNPKLALPVMLLGLLALDTSWQNFTNSTFSQSFASEEASAAEFRAEATQICSDANNGYGNAVKTSLANALTHGASQYKMAKSDGSAITGKVDGKKYKYKGNVLIEKIVDSKQAHQIDPAFGGTIARDSDYFGGTSQIQKEDPIKGLDPRTGKTITAVPEYSILKIKVTSETTEGDWCDGCENEMASASSEVRYIKMRTLPAPTTKTELCIDAIVDSKMLFHQSEENLKSEIEKQLEEIARIAKEDKLFEDRDRLEDNCDIRKGASLEDVEEYLEEGSISGRYSYDDKPEEKMTCMSKNMKDIKNRKDKDAYFSSKMMPHVKQLLTSVNEDERKQGMELLQKLGRNNYGALSGVQRSYVNRAYSGATMMSEVYRLNGLIDRSSGIHKQNYEMQLQSILNQAEVQFVHTPNTYGPQMPAEVANDFGYWYDSIKNVNGLQYQVTGVTPTGMVNIAGRNARLLPGETPFLNQGLIDRIRQMEQNLGPGYMVGGTSSPMFNQTMPPTPEMSTSGNRLARGRN